MSAWVDEDGVRAWAYDLTIEWDDADEGGLHPVELLPVLIECADDESCPRRDFLLSFLEQRARTAFVFRRTDETPRFVAAAAGARSPELREWATFVGRLDGYLQLAPPLGRARIQEIAGDLLIGPRLLARFRAAGHEREGFPFEVKVHPEIKDVWAAAQTYQPFATHLYVDGRTGAWWVRIGKVIAVDELRTLVRDARRSTTR